MSLERRGQILAGKVTNEALVDDGAVPQHLTAWPVLPAGVGKGWGYDGTNFTAPVAVYTAENVKTEREKRVKLGMLHRGKTWQIDLESRNLIAGAVQGAILWKSGGGAGTSLRWRDTGEDATWTAADNSELTFTADEMITFGIAVLSHMSDLHKAAKQIRADDPIPDPQTDPRWPA